ncbi:MAG: GntR family transcriptional regulator [Cellvibrionaceae bacterium]
MIFSTANGSVPLYAQVQELLITRIIKGEWSPTEIIPSEIKLARELGVSQGTIRKAITGLVERKVLIRRHGKGTFVAGHNNARALFQFFRIHNEENEKALPESKTLTFTERCASTAESKKLKLPKKARIFFIERIRSLGGQPILVESIALPDHFFQGLKDIDLLNTLYDLYEIEFSITVHRAEESLRAISASKHDAVILNLTEGAPLLEIERLALTLDNVPIELRVSRCTTEKHHYWNTLY